MRTNHFYQQLLVALLPLICVTASATKFHIMEGGVDDPKRDGRTWDTSWASLAFACEQVPDDGGAHTIVVRTGTYIAERTAYPKSGTTITGEGAWGKKGSHIIASKDWKLSETFKPEEPPAEEHLISFTKKSNITIKRLSLTSPKEHRITGGILCRHSKDVTIEDIVFKDFRWNGAMLYISRGIEVAKCYFENTSTDKMRHWGGLLRSRYLKDSEIHHNQIIQRVGGGYGYKASGHENVRIHHNHIDIRGGFGIESAHENEYGCEIDHNWINSCISIPKPNQAADPNKRGFPCSFWIHHNYLSDSYTIEGPRNHLIFEHNHVNISKTNGRVYTHHGGTNNGPVIIRNNVIENVDRALIWMNNGLAENIHIYNNSIFCADAGPRTGALLGVPKAERANNWTFKNNIVVSAWTKPRRVGSNNPLIAAKMDITNNLFINCTGVPKSNFSENDPGLTRKPGKPAPFWLPSSTDSFVVDRGTDLGRPFEGKAPDLGAFEFGAEPWQLKEIPKGR